MSFGQRNTEVRGDGEWVPQISFGLSEVLEESRQGQEVRPMCDLLVQRIRRGISAGNYLTPEKIDKVVGCVYRELFGR
jgi:hypothetical protein